MSGETEIVGWPARTFEALLKLLSVHPQLPGEAPVTARLTPLGWREFDRTKAVESLRLMVGSRGRDPAQNALHSGRIGGDPIGGAGGLRVANPASEPADGSRERS